MDGPGNYHAKWNQSDNETATLNVVTDMWNRKKGQTELLCRTDADSKKIKNFWSPEETVWGVGDVLGLWDENLVKLDCYDHYTTIDVINSFE